MQPAFVYIFGVPNLILLTLLSTCFKDRHQKFNCCIKACPHIFVSGPQVWLPGRTTCHCWYRTELVGQDGTSLCRARCTFWCNPAGHGNFWGKCPALWINLAQQKKFFWVTIPSNKWLDGCIYPGWKMTCFDHEIIFWKVQKTTGYHPGPVAPLTADGASLVTTFKGISLKVYQNTTLGFLIPCWSQFI